MSLSLFLSLSLSEERHGPRCGECKGEGASVEAEGASLAASLCEADCGAGRSWRLLQRALSLFNISLFDVSLFDLDAPAHLTAALYLALSLFARDAPTRWSSRGQVAC